MNSLEKATELIDDIYKIINDNIDDITSFVKNRYTDKDVRNFEKKKCFKQRILDDLEINKHNNINYLKKEIDEDSNEDFSSLYSYTMYEDYSTPHMLDEEYIFNEDYWEEMDKLYKEENIDTPIKQFRIYFDTDKFHQDIYMLIVLKDDLSEILYLGFEGD